MRPQLEDIKLLEQYMHKLLPLEKRQEVDIRLLWDKEWQQNLYSQQRAYQAICEEGRKQLKQELEAIHSRLFHK
jgi:monoamine oxidase